MAMPLVLQTTVNRLTLAMAALALLLAVVNVYALSAFAVVQRTTGDWHSASRSGARAVDAMRLVMRCGLVVDRTSGLALGMEADGVFLVAPLLQRQLYRDERDRSGAADR